MTKFNHVPVKLPELKTTTIDRKRFYITPKQKYYPSITTVLSIRNKKGLMEWRKRVGDEVANYVSGKAASRGTKVHHMCEDYLNNMERDFPDKWEKHKNDFLPWCLFGQLKNKVLDNINDIYGQECGLYSDKYKVAGRVDCIAKYNGVLSIIDFKTSTKERSDSWNEIVVLVVTEDGVVQEFIKDKNDYLDALRNSVVEWENQNETDSNGHPIVYGA